MFRKKTKSCKSLPQGKQKGVALLEALIAVLLFSIGVMALVGLQATMSRNVTQAKFRGEAAYLANQLIGQMWVDQANLGNYEISSDSCTNSGYANCTAWLSQVNRMLPSGSAEVSVNAGAVGITISWRMQGEEPSQLQIDANINN